MSDLLLVLYTTLAGLVIIGMGQVFEALREIALNTREAARKRAGFIPSENSYMGLKTIAGIYNLLGVLVILGGIVITVYFNLFDVQRPPIEMIPLGFGFR